MSVYNTIHFGNEQNYVAVSFEITRHAETLRMRWNGKPIALRGWHCNRHNAEDKARTLIAAEALQRGLVVQSIKMEYGATLKVKWTLRAVLVRDPALYGNAS